jgi:iron-sulfur cluster insertion protein
MVNITENAAIELKKVLGNGNKTATGLRIFIVDVSCCGPEYGLSLAEKPQKNDVVSESHGIKIFVSEEVAKELNSSVIEYEETPYGSGFIIDNPTAFPTCSSGGSGACH